MAVARARSGCALGVAVTAAAIAGSDGADGGYGHGSDEGWKGQGTAAEAVGGGKNGTQGKAGREENCEVTFWLTLPCLYKLVTAAEGSFPPNFHYT